MKRQRQLPPEDEPEAKRRPDDQLAPVAVFIAEHPQVAIRSFDEPGVILPDNVRQILETTDPRALLNLESTHRFYQTPEGKRLLGFAWRTRIFADYRKPFDLQPYRIVRNFDALYISTDAAIYLDAACVAWEKADQAVAADPTGETQAREARDLIQGLFRSSSFGLVTLVEKSEIHDELAAMGFGLLYAPIELEQDWARHYADFWKRAYFLTAQAIILRMHIINPAHLLLDRIMYPDDTPIARLNNLATHFVPDLPGQGWRLVTFDDTPLVALAVAPAGTAPRDSFGRSPLPFDLRSRADVPSAMYPDAEQIVTDAMSLVDIGLNRVSWTSGRLVMHLFGQRVTPRWSGELTVDTSSAPSDPDHPILTAVLATDDDDIPCLKLDVFDAVSDFVPFIPSGPGFTRWNHGIASVRAVDLDALERSIHRANNVQRQIVGSPYLSFSGDVVRAIFRDLSWSGSEYRKAFIDHVKARHRGFSPHDLFTITSQFQTVDDSIDISRIAEASDRLVHIQALERQRGRRMPSYWGLVQFAILDFETEFSRLDDASLLPYTNESFIEWMLSDNRIVSRDHPYVFFRSALSDLSTTTHARVDPASGVITLVAKTTKED